MIPNIMSASVRQAAVERKFRIRHSKKKSGCNSFCCYVCTEGLVSLHTPSGWVTDTLSLWPHLNSNPSQTADHKHTSTKAVSFRYAQCAALGGGDLLTEVVCVFCVIRFMDQNFSGPVRHQYCVRAQTWHGHFIQQQKEPKQLLGHCHDMNSSYSNRRNQNSS